MQNDINSRAQTPDSIPNLTTWWNESLFFLLIINAHSKVVGEKSQEVYSSLNTGKDSIQLYNAHNMHGL